MVGPAANNIPTNSAREERDVNLNATAHESSSYTYPMAAFSLELPDHTQFNPLRVDYDNPVFFQLNQPSNHEWPTPWVVIPENLTETDWVWNFEIRFLKLSTLTQQGLSPHPRKQK